MAQRQARGAHNSEDIGSKPIAGILIFIQVQSLFKTSYNRCRVTATRGDESASLRNTIDTYRRYLLVFVQVQSLFKTSSNRCGVAEAHSCVISAENVGSKPTAGILVFIQVHSLFKTS
jgi:hypothetical protein